MEHDLYIILLQINEKLDTITNKLEEIERDIFYNKEEEGENIEQQTRTTIEKKPN